MLSSTAVAKSIINLLSETDSDKKEASHAPPTAPADAATAVRDPPAPALHFPPSSEYPSSAHPKLASLHLSEVHPTSAPFSSDGPDDQDHRDDWDGEATIHHRQRIADQIQERAKCLNSLGAVALAVADGGESVEKAESARGYLPIENYGIIGNMRTAALVATDASIDFMCFPKFDSPSVFCRLLDHEKGGYYQIHPTQATSHRQQYLPNSNVLVTRFLAENSASQVTDFFHVPDSAKEPDPSSHIPTPRPGANWYATPLVSATSKPLYPWLIRVVESVRGRVEFDIVVQPAFGYALASHETLVLPAESVAAASRDLASLDASYNPTVVFNSLDDLNLDLRYVAYEACSETGCRAPLPKIQWEVLEDAVYKGPGVKAKFTLNEGQQVWFVLRERPPQPRIVVSKPHAEAAVSSPPAGQRLSPMMAGVGNVAARPACSSAHKTHGPPAAAMALRNRFPMDPHGMLPSSEPGTPELGPIRPHPTHHVSTSSLQLPPSDFFLAGQAMSTFITRGDDATPKPPMPTDSPNGSASASTSTSYSHVDSPPPLGSALNSAPRQASSMTFPRVCGLPAPQKIPGTPNTPMPATCAEMDPPLTVALVQSLLRSTLRYWNQWIGQCTYKGRWRETVQRSALALKLLTYQPTGAVIAAPTFSLPEEVCGGRTWDYRWVWLRDSSFVIYAFIRLGLISEARSFMRFIELVARDRNPDGSLNVMYTIEANRNIPELELSHLHGYRGSRPVRIGNAASTHLQLDIYGALLDTVYLMNKYSSPVGYDMWCVCQALVNYVVSAWTLKDMSIWEVRGKPMHFVYSKVMCWVAVDRGLRLAEKRMFPCPDRAKWLESRDAIYLEVMEKGWDKDRQCFKQAYESDALDASVLIMPLVFFLSPTDPRLLSTIAAILKPPELDGLTSNGLVYRYLSLGTDDGVGTGEGSFTMCGFWLVEALARAGMYIDKYKPRALYAFEQMLSYANHLDLYSEEVSGAGELVGNFPQAFTHIALISCAFNLDRILGK